MKVLLSSMAVVSLASAQSSSTYQSPSLLTLRNMENANVIGAHTALICEATDWKYASKNANGQYYSPADGASGDDEFPYGRMKVLATVGEYDKDTGYVLVGVPDGMGTMLTDANTVRVVFQSESYGPLSQHESYPFIVNSNGASFTGSHVMYVDYDRSKLATFMDNKAGSAAGMVKGAGSLVENAYNLKGQLITGRPASGCSSAPHFSNTDPDGCGAWTGIMDSDEPSDADWLMQSLCSAHLEEKHQWGGQLGLEDDIFITNEEWTSFVTGSDYTGIPGHAVDIANRAIHAVGAFTLGGFEKIVEFNCGVEGYVCFSPSGYNGNFGVDGKAEAARKNLLGKRPDGTDYYWPQDVVPARIYIGKKGYNAQGQPATDFLSRNGLAWGKLYGFGMDMSAAGPTAGMWRDDFHKNGFERRTLDGKFYPIDWQWDGEVRQFNEDGSWEFQHHPDAADSDVHFWTGKGRDAAGSKMEHNSPDPKGGQRFMQSSTAGYFGIYAATGLTAALRALGSSSTSFPGAISATYDPLEGEVDIRSQIKLGGKGRKANGEYQVTMSDSVDPAAGVDSAKVTFEDIDGLEWIAAKDHAEGYVVLQEDGGNKYGERAFFAKVDKDAAMEYHFIGMSGGNYNTRTMAGVGVPKGTNGGLDTHEFSGVIDLSGVVAKDASGAFRATAGDGQSKRTAEAAVDFEDKILALGLQAHNLDAGIVAALGGDRGGQVFAFRPSLSLVDHSEPWSTPAPTKQPTAEPTEQPTPAPSNNSLWRWILMSIFGGRF